MRFEKVNGYNAIQDNENETYTLCEYEPKQYNVGEFDIEDLLNLLNQMNQKILDLEGQKAYLIGKIEEDE